MTLPTQLGPLPAARTTGSKTGTRVKLSSIPIVIALVIAALVTRGSGGGTDFRLAAATTRDVTKSLDEVGTIEPVSAASVAFPVAGKVASIAVAAGATVTRGQVLAALDPTTLRHAVDSAQAALDQAKLALANAKAGTGSSTPSSSSNGRVAAQAVSDTPAKSDSSDALGAAQDAVLNAQQNVDAKLAAAQAALASATGICAAIPADGSDSTSVAACQSALSDVLSVQHDASDAQGALSNASNAFDSLLAQQAAQGSSNGSTPTTAPSNGNGASSSTASVADLAADQAAIDAAVAALAVANQDVAAATIVSPIDGTIESINIAVGDAVTAASATANISIVGGAGYEVTAIVGVAKLADIKLGQPASVTPDASDKKLAGQVVAIGAPRTANGSTTYPVSIGLDDDAALRNGTVAAIAITTGSVSDGLAVPTSAVHVETGRSFVYVVDGSKTKAVDVVVGVVGKSWTQIKSGLKAGQEVVLADLNEALPGSATSSSNSNQNNGNGNNVRVPFVFNGGGPPQIITGGG